MRRTFIAIAGLLLISCGGQTTADPCVLRVNVLDVQNAFVGNTRTAEAELEVRQGFCSQEQKELSWRSSATDIAEILSTTDSTATVRAKKAGTAYIAAFLTRTPTVKDSVRLTVTTLVDTVSALPNFRVR